MKGLKVKCPNCTRICFETTDQFNPNVPPHGGMVKFLLQYHIDWLCVPTTKASEMCCPECLAPLVVGGVLNVIIPARDAGEAFKNDGTGPVIEYLEPPIIPQMEELNELVDKTWGGITSESVEKDTKEKVEALQAATTIDGGDRIQTPKAPGFICDVCGKECKSELGLKSHKRSHK